MDPAPSMPTLEGCLVPMELESRPTRAPLAAAWAEEPWEELAAVLVASIPRIRPTTVTVATVVATVATVATMATVVTGVTVDTPDPEVTLMAPVTLVTVGYYKMNEIFTDLEDRTLVIFFAGSLKN